MLDTATLYLSALASPITSTGLLIFAVFGRLFFKMSVVVGENFGKSNPKRIAASVVKTPGPPALVTIAILLLFGSG